MKTLWINRGTSNFCSELVLDEDCENMVKAKPDGFYDVISDNDTIEGGTPVVLREEYLALRAQCEQLAKILYLFTKSSHGWIAEEALATYSKFKEKIKVNNERM